MHCHTYLSNSLYRLKAILIPSVLFILVFLVACPDAPFFEDEEEPETLSITGTVTDANSGLPIADATVQVFSRRGFEVGEEVLKSTKTDQEGLYYIAYQGPFDVGPSDPFGYLQPIQLSAKAEGYYWLDSQIQNTELLQTINFQLSPLN